MGVVVRKTAEDYVVELRSEGQRSVINHLPLDFNTRELRELLEWVVSEADVVS